MTDYIMGYIPKGKQNAISNKELAHRMNTTARVVRKLIEEARQNGEPICSGDEGYWIGDREDIRRTLKRLYSQVKMMRCTIKGLELALSEVDE